MSDLVQGYGYTIHGAFEDGQDYKSLVHQCVKEQWIPAEPFTGEVKVVITEYRNIPKDWNEIKRKKAKVGAIKPTVPPNCDNICNVIFDAMNGLVWEDSSQVTDLQVLKRYCATDPCITMPRVYVDVFFKGGAQS